MARKVCVSEAVHLLFDGGVFRTEARTLTESGLAPQPAVNAAGVG